MVEYRVIVGGECNNVGCRNESDAVIVGSRATTCGRHAFTGGDTRPLVSTVLVHLVECPSKLVCRVLYWRIYSP